MAGPMQGVGGKGPPKKSTTTGAFGTTSVTEQHAEISAYATRYADDRVFSQTTASTGSITLSGGEVVLATGASAGGRAELWTVANSSYIPGHGLLGLWTSRHPDGGVAGTDLYSGMFTPEAGVGVGYNGATFGMLFRRGGRLEIRSAVIDVAASAGETVTITLNGTGHAVSVTAGTVQQNAREIAEHGAGYADATGGYDVIAIDDTVYWIRQTAAACAGAFTLSSSGTMDATGGVVQTEAGVAPTDNWVAQSAWDDPCDGSGASGITIDPTVGQIWRLSWGYLGYLGAQLWVGHPGRQEFVPVHFYPWAGTPDCTETSTRDPRFNMRYIAESTTGTTNVRIAGASVFSGIEGHGDQLGPTGAVTSGFVSSISSTEIPILSLRCSPVDLRNGRRNRRRIIVQGISVANVGSKELVFRVYVGSSFNLVAYDFQSGDVDEIALTDTAASAITGTLDLRHVRAVAAGADAEIAHNNSEHPLFADGEGQVLIVTAACVGASTSTGIVSVNFHEDP